MADNNIKVLVTGSTNGRFKELFTKAKQIHEKYGPFDLHLCTGNFFSNQQEEQQENIQELLDNKIDVPIMTYFITGETPIPDNVQQHMEATDGELCSNLYFLGKQGILSTSQGLRIAFLSGTAYTEKDIDKLCQSTLPLGGVDFLITHEWPQAIGDGSSISVSKVASALKPRYHFAASQNQFFEREPYKNMVSGFGKDEVPVDYVTRFIGLGDMLNGNKQRWFYAFNLIPLSKAPRESINVVPDNTTENPFMSLFGNNKRKEPENSAFFWGEDAKRAKITDVPKGNYVCKICNIPGHYIKDCPQKQQKQQQQQQDGDYVCKICNVPGHHIRDCPQKEKLPEDYVCHICNQPGHRVRDCPERKTHHDGEKPKLETCWFCLSNPKVEKHLIVSIGTEMYATLAKGPVVSPDDSESKVPGIGHLLLVPITHYPTLGKIPMPAKIEVISETEKYKNATRHLFNKYDQDMLVFETSKESLRGLSHAHLQIVPIPKSKSANIEDTVRELGAKYNMDFVEQIPENPMISFFKIELPNGKSLVHIIKPKTYFNLQFGRLVAATVLEHPEREDWKACSQSEQEERKEAALFKEAFKPFDFTLEDA